MARRVSWTNNSTGHSGTYVYRAPTLDPQNLPAPVATVAPVAQGEIAEWDDTSGEYGCFAVQDFDEQGAVGTLSSEVCIADPLTTALIGDEIEGGIYMGLYTGTATSYHLIASKSDGDLFDVAWKTSTTTSSGVDSLVDGHANTQSMVSLGIASFPAAQHCVNYAGGGLTDWYLPSRDELQMMYANLGNHAEFSNLSARTHPACSSSEYSANYVWNIKFSDGTVSNTYTNKDNALWAARPIRRVPA